MKILMKQIAFHELFYYSRNMKDKAGLHPRNKHKSSYDFKELISSSWDLAPFVSKNKFGNDSIDFSNPLAVKALNAALLKFYYHISSWDIPKDYLCPPIPGRADYIHHIADLLADKNGIIPKGPSIKMLDIGVGANCVYPLIAHAEYGWSVVGSEVDPVALTNANTIIKDNALDSSITLREQKDKTKIFENIISSDDFFHLTVCNPPFHSSAQEAREGTNRKNKNLGLKKNVLNFGGQNNELWCEGGEIAFIFKMIQESTRYKKNCLWFSTLVSKSSTLPSVYDELKKVNIARIRTIDMAQGQKKSRIVAWSFQS